MGAVISQLPSLCPNMGMNVYYTPHPPTHPPTPPPTHPPTHSLEAVEMRRLRALYRVGVEFTGWPRRPPPTPTIAMDIRPGIDTIPPPTHPPRELRTITTTQCYALFPPRRRRSPPPPPHRCEMATSGYARGLLHGAVHVRT